MSKHKNEREVHSLNVFYDAKEHYYYVKDILANKNNFDPEIEPEAPVILERLKEEAYNMYMDAWTANNVVMDARNINPKAWEIREEYQIKSILACVRMLGNISIARKVFHIPGRRMKSWTKKVKDIRNQLVNWHKADVKRYSA